MNPYIFYTLIFLKVFFVAGVIFTCIQLITGYAYCRGRISRRSNPWAYWLNLIFTTGLLLGYTGFMIPALEKLPTHEPLSKKCIKVTSPLANKISDLAQPRIKNKYKIIKLHGQWTIVKDPSYKTRHDPKPAEDVLASDKYFPPTLPPELKQIKLYPNHIHTETHGNSLSDPQGLIAYETARNLIQQGQTKTALPYLKYTTHYYPNFLPAHYELGKLYDEEGQVSEAIQEYKIGVAALPPNCPVRHHLETRISLAQSFNR